MRAVVHDRYGPPDVLRIEDVQRPVPAEDELLVRVHATTVTQTDCHMRAARPFVWRFMLGLRRPRRRTLGLEFAGVVEDVGSAVTQFAVGGCVFGLCSSAHAEYVCVRESRLVAAIPAGMSFEEAAAVCDGMSHGASGSLGTGAVQLAHYLGAHVTAVCNTPNVQLVRSLGADEVIDYTQEDFTESGRVYDVVLDAVGKFSFARSRGSLAPGGLYVATDRPYNFPLALLTKWVGTRKVVFSSEGYKRESVLLLKELLEAGRYRAVVDRTYPLEQVVEATRYVESWQKAGNVVLALQGAAS